MSPPSTKQLEAQLALAEKQAEAWRLDAGQERRRTLELEERLRTRDQTIVQLGIRLAAYGDPALTPAQKED